MASSSSEPAVELKDLLPQIRAAQMDIQVHVSVTLNITPFVARQKVGGLVLSEVGTGIGADEPTLVLSNKRVVWRVPVFLALPGLGRLGQVGEVDVDAQTGEVLADRPTLNRMIDNANRLAPDSAS
jgi:hypothetical protein